MNNENYNGWTNYATWRVNLELIDSDYYTDWISDNREYYRDLQEHRYVLSEQLKEDIESYIIETSGDENSTATSYALAFVNDVNWYEIAEHIFNDYLDM